MAEHLLHSNCVATLSLTEGKCEIKTFGKRNTVFRLPSVHLKFIAVGQVRVKKTPHINSTASLFNQLITAFCFSGGETFVIRPKASSQRLLPAIKCYFERGKKIKKCFTCSTIY